MNFSPFETITISKETALTMNDCNYANVTINDIDELIEVILNNKTNEQVLLSLIINEVNDYGHYGRDEFYKKLYLKRDEIPQFVKKLILDNVDLLNSLRSAVTLSVITNIELHQHLLTIYSGNSLAREIVYLVDFETIQYMFNEDNFVTYLNYFQDYTRFELFKTQEMFDYFFEIKGDYYREDEFANGFIERYLTSTKFRKFKFIKEKHLISIFNFTQNKTNSRVKRFVEIVKMENPNFNNFARITQPQPKDLI